MILTDIMTISLSNDRILDFIFGEIQVLFTLGGAAISFSWEGAVPGYWGGHQPSIVYPWQSCKLLRTASKLAKQN